MEDDTNCFTLRQRTSPITSFCLTQIIFNLWCSFKPVLHLPGEKCTEGQAHSKYGLEIFQSCVDTILCHELWHDWSRNLEQVWPTVVLPAWPFLLKSAKHHFQWAPHFPLSAGRSLLAEKTLLCVLLSVTHGPVPVLEWLQHAVDEISDLLSWIVYIWSMGAKRGKISQWQIAAGKCHSQQGWQMSNECSAMACEESCSFTSTSMQSAFIMTDILLRAGFLSPYPSWASLAQVSPVKQSSISQIVIPVCKPGKHSTLIRICSGFAGVGFQSVADEYNEWKSEKSGLGLCLFFFFQYEI